MGYQNGICKLFRGFAEFRKPQGSFIEIKVDDIPSNQKAFISGKWGTGKSSVIKEIESRFHQAYPVVSLSEFSLTPSILSAFLKSVEKLERQSLILIDNLSIKDADNNLVGQFINIIQGLSKHLIFISIDSNNISKIKAKDEFDKLNQFEWISLDDDEIISPDVKEVLSSFKGSYFLAGSVWNTEDQTERFLVNGIWEHGFEAELPLVQKVLPNDIVFLKSSFPRDTTPILRIKAVGRVIENLGDGIKLKVEWIIKDQTDIRGIGHYRSTFMELSTEDLPTIITEIGKDKFLNLLSSIKTTPENISTEFNMSNKLKNGGEEIRNDVLYPEGPFDVINNSYILTIFPKTEFWRFGVRLSRRKEIKIDLKNSDRHADRSCRDIHVSAGSIPFSTWSQPENFELNQYHIPERDHVLYRSPTYEPLSPVTFRITHISEEKVLEVAVSAKGCKEYITRIPYDEFRYFKIFAWADLIAFDLDFVIEVMTLTGTAKLIQRKYTPPEKWHITEDDVGVIGVQDLAVIVGNMLKNLKQNDKGKMIGIFGPWGRGKTFLVDHTWKLLDAGTEKPFIRINFHAWKYQDTPASWAYLYESFAEKYFSSDKKTLWGKWWEKLCKKVDLNWKRIGPGPILFLILTIIGGIVSFLCRKELESILGFFLFFGVISLTTIQILQIIKKSVSEKAKELFGKYYNKVSFSNLLGTQAEIQNELRLLLQHWLKEVKPKKDKKDPDKENTNGVIEKRILLFVDDIDRCKEDRIMEIIDALRVMLEDEEISKRVVVLAAIDERVLKRAIKCKYHDILNKDCEIDKEIGSIKEISGSITREYMDKLFLSGISLGSLSEVERQKILGKYIRGRISPRIIQKSAEESKKEDNLKDSVSSSLKNDTNNVEFSDEVKPTDDLSIEVIVEDEIIKLDDSKYDLTKDEEEHLTNLMLFCPLFTPRQIRIFYYRYLLGRNILKIRYEKEGKPITKISLERFANLILNFSVTKDSDALKKAKTKTANADGPVTSIDVFGNNEAFDKNELLEFLEVIEIVVSY
jgi:hypothetical protein